LSALIELVFSLVITVLCLTCILPLFGVVDVIESRMNEVVVAAAVDRSQVVSRYTVETHSLRKAVIPEGLWIDQKYVIPMNDLSFLASGKKLNFNDGFCTLGGTLRVGSRTLVVLPVTGVVKKGD